MSQTNVNCNVAYKSHTPESDYCLAKTRLAKLRSPTKNVATYQKVLTYLLCIVLSLILGFFLYATLMYSLNKKQESYFSGISRFHSEHQATSITVMILTAASSIALGVFVGSLITHGKPWAEKTVSKSDEEVTRDNIAGDSLAADERFHGYEPL